MHLQLGSKLNRLPDCTAVTMRKPNPVVGACAKRYKHYMDTTNLGMYRQFGSLDDLKRGIAAEHLTFDDKAVCPLIATIYSPSVEALLTTTYEWSHRFTFNRSP